MWTKLMLTTVVALLGFGSSNVLAQATLGVEPPVTLYSAVPGQSVTTNLKIGNPSPKPVRVRVSLGDWNYSQMGELQYFSTGKLSTSASAWTKVSDNILEIPGKEVATVRYTFTVPRDATPGSYWGMVFLTAESENPPPGVINASMSVRVAHTFYVNVPPTKSSGKIAGIFGKPSTPEGKSFQFAVQYLNSGNIAQILEGRLEVRDTTGAIVAAAPFKRQVVLPGATRILQSSLNGPLPVGEYTALVILNYGDKNRDIAGEYTFRLKTALRE